MIYGYARVSTKDQSTDMQLNALEAAGISQDKIFSDVISGLSKDRPEFNKLLDLLTPGDTLVVWKLDRLGRSVRNLSTFLEDMNTRGVVIRSLVDGLDTSNKSSKMLYHMLAIISEMERDNINERIREGIKNASKHGTKSGKAHGRPRVASPKVQLALDLVASGESIRMASRKTGVSERTLYRRIDAIKQNGDYVKQVDIFNVIRDNVKQERGNIKQKGGLVK